MNQQDEAIATASDGPVIPADTLTCNVCGGESGHPALGVAGSSLGAISFAYCRPCLAFRAEPYGLLRSIVLYDAGGLDNCADWVRTLTTWHEGRYILASELPPLTDEEIAEYDQQAAMYGYGPGDEGVDDNFSLADGEG